MAVQLEIHPANDAERVELFRNVYDVWGRGLSLQEHLKRRLASTQHRRAAWFVGCWQGRVATSLGAYPLEFRIRDEIVPGIAIGAVHTHADFRGRGFAPLLVEWVERYMQREAGAGISLLYSDIKASYYARLGYVECPSWEADFDPADARYDPPDGQPVKVERLSLAEGRVMMAERYAAGHASDAVSIHRSGDYWDYLIRKEREDTLYRVGDRGYVRVRFDDSTCTLRDVSAGTDDREEWRILASAVTTIARQRAASRVTGWVPQILSDTAEWELRPRTTEITMLKPLHEEIAIDETARQSADFFHEIDHV